ncbi:MAG: family 16 glycoside hydrolase [Planctomycetota bacterium]|nr:family 16 glycoside hydrolase [Planctomycetota bacterium]
MQNPHYFIYLLSLSWLLTSNTLLCGQEWKSGITWKVPQTVSPGPVGGPPEDAIILFDGKDMSAFEGGENWRVRDGYVVADKNGISSRQAFGDCQLHLEFASPPGDKGTGQGRGNSGIYLMGRYEVQILDSFDNPTYPDGQAAAIYKQSPPLVNASRPPGEWQSMDIVFRAPRFADDKTLLRPASVTVLHNGVVVQNDFELEGSTAWDSPPAYSAHADKLPLHIQYHGDPVRFRNIWIREIDLASKKLNDKQSAQTSPPQRIDLWRETPPHAKGDAEKDRPYLEAYLPDPDFAVGTGVVVFPGGGYGALAKGHEGAEIARWLQSLGIAAVVCDYRHQGKGYRHPAPLEDAQQAIRMVRARAKDWNLKPDRIGAMGFSAGGHLASALATHFDDGDQSASDPVSQQSSRPDFLVLGYPLIALGQPYTHARSQRNLLGENPDVALLKKLSSEKQVTSDTPPVFLWHTGEDTGVVPEHSIAFYQALRNADVPVELHIYEQGRHGLGLARSVPTASDWTARCTAWMRSRGLLDRNP